MPITANNVSFHKSAAVNGAVHSLGGVIGDALSSQTATQPAIITGVYISQAFGNIPGLGQMTYNPVTQELSWKPPGSATTVIQPLTTSGSYTLFTAEGTVIVTVTIGSLPSTYKVENITIANPIGTLFNQVTGTMSLIGDVQYRCIYFKNSHSTLTATDIRLYLHVMPALPQLIAIGLDPVGPGNGTTTGVAQTVATEYDVPIGVTFTAPTQASTGIQLGDLLAGESIAIWQRRTVPEMAYGPLAIITTTLGVALVG